MLYGALQSFDDGYKLLVKSVVLGLERVQVGGRQKVDRSAHHQPTVQVFESLPGPDKEPEPVDGMISGHTKGGIFYDGKGVIAKHGYHHVLLLLRKGRGTPEHFRGEIGRQCQKLEFESHWRLIKAADT